MGPLGTEHTQREMEIGLCPARPLWGPLPRPQACEAGLAHWPHQRPRVGVSGCVARRAPRPSHRAWTAGGIHFLRQKMGWAGHARGGDLTASPKTKLL